MVHTTGTDWMQGIVFGIDIETSLLTSLGGLQFGGQCLHQMPNEQHHDTMTTRIHPNWNSQTFLTHLSDIKHQKVQALTQHFRGANKKHWPWPALPRGGQSSIKRSHQAWMDMTFCRAVTNCDHWGCFRMTVPFFVWSKDLNGSKKGTSFWDISN